METAKETVRLPLVQVALPIMLTFVVATWHQNKRIDDFRSDMNRQFPDIKGILEAIQGKLEYHNERITRLEERTSPLTSTRR